MIKLLYLEYQQPVIHDINSQLTLKNQDLEYKAPVIYYGEVVGTKQVGVGLINDSRRVGGGGGGAQS